MFNDQIEFKTKRRKYQTDIRAKESSHSETSSEIIISPEKEQEKDDDFELEDRFREPDEPRQEEAGARGEQPKAGGMGFSLINQNYSLQVV